MGLKYVDAASSASWVLQPALFHAVVTHGVAAKATAANAVTCSLVLLRSPHRAKQGRDQVRTISYASPVEWGNMRWLVATARDVLQVGN